jgi:5-methyltetrahydropteroyltriglutamate--homocysteine methyltransferase
LIDKYIAVTNQILAAAPKEMYIGMHLCRGNRGGHWHADGSYEEVADRLFNALAIPFYFLEYDTPRAGSFTPLRFVPKHKMVVLGLVSTKIPELEDKGALKRRLDDATKFVSFDRLAISPQCGFASVDTGNPVTAETQNRKFELVCEFAREIWGET